MGIGLILARGEAAADTGQVVVGTGG